MDCIILIFIRKLYGAKYYLPPDNISDGFLLDADVLDLINPMPVISLCTEKYDKNWIRTEEGDKKIVFKYFI